MRGLQYKPCRNRINTLERERILYCFRNRYEIKNRSERRNIYRKNHQYKEIEMKKWSILIEVDAENIAEFNKAHFDGQSLFIKCEDVLGIMIVDEDEKC